MGVCYQPCIRMTKKQKCISMRHSDAVSQRFGSFEVSLLLKALDLFTSVRDWGRQLCRHASRRKKLPFCFAPLHKGMECEDHWCLGLFLSEFKRHYEKLVKGNKCSRTSSPTKNNHNFRPAIPTHATNQLRTTQVAFQPGDSKVVTIDQEIAIYYAMQRLLQRLHRLRVPSGMTWVMGLVLRRVTFWGPIGGHCKHHCVTQEWLPFPILVVVYINGSLTMRPKIDQVKYVQTQQC